MLAKINYRRLSGSVCKRHPFSRGIGIPRTRSRILPAAVQPRRSYNARPSPTQNKFAAIFLFRAPHIHTSRRFSFRGGACSAPRKRRREAAVGWSVRFLDVGPRLVNGMRRDGTRLGRGRREVSGWQARGCESVDAAARSVPGFAGNFFSSSLAREMTYDIFLRGFCWLVSG